MKSAPKMPTDDPDERGAVDAAALNEARDVLHALANAVSAMKIFPSDHASVAGFVDQLTQKFTAFLAERDRLQVGIEEYSFTYEGQPVYFDEAAIKSLPFFFFKDGLQVLFFYQGLDRAEILEFLELIKAEMQKPAEDSDIVIALWERDFPNIQYYAPDEFLENRILGEARESRARGDRPAGGAGATEETIEVRVDASKLSQGRIELDRADREQVEQAAARPEPEEASPGPPGAAETSEAAGAGSEERGSISPAAAMDATLTEAELHALEAMLRANRTISPEEEYINLMVEIIYLDEDPDHCRASLDALLDYHFEELQRGHFRAGVLIIRKIHELGRHLEGQDKAPLLDEFLKRTVSPKTVEAIKVLLDKRADLDWESLLGFFELLGPPALPLAADLFELAEEGRARPRIAAFIEKAGGANPGLLAGLADRSRPALALEIVDILARLPGGLGIPHLSAFVNFPGREIRSAAIRALGRAGDERANRILAGFLNDPDEGLRIQATGSLDPAHGRAQAQQVLKEVATREFSHKGLKEKEALLAFLGRTRSAEALEFLRRTLARAPLFASKATVEVRLAAVAGLESLASAEAVEVLRKGASSRPRAVREACAAALGRLAGAAGAKG